MRNTTANQIMEILKGLNDIHISNYKEFMKRRQGGLVRHARKGEILTGEGKGVKVQAYGYDDLGNITAITTDGFVKQFI